MDLVTLVTACALAIDPQIMHALIWHQSGGEPWSFTVPEERQPQVYRTIGDAVRAAHATYPNDVAIRVGLTGLSATPRSTTAVMFAPCSNVAIAARQIAQLAERCAASRRFKGDLTYCAIAAYHGSWERPDNAFANAVRTSVANNDAPDFEMPANTEIDVADSESAPHSRNIAEVPPPAPDDRERAWSSALFPARSPPFDRSSTGGSASDRPAVDTQKSDTPNTRPTPARPHAEDLFVPRSAPRNSP